MLQNLHYEFALNQVHESFSCLYMRRKTNNRTCSASSCCVLQNILATTGWRALASLGRTFCSCGLGGLLQIKPPFFSCRKLNLKNTSLHKNNIIYIIKQEGLYQNKVNSRLVFIDNCKLWPFCYWSINSSNVENESTQPPPISNPGVYAIIIL